MESTGTVPTTNGTPTETTETVKLTALQALAVQYARTKETQKQLRHIAAIVAVILATIAEKEDGKAIPYGMIDPSGAIARNWYVFGVYKSQLARQLAKYDRVVVFDDSRNVFFVNAK